MKKTIVWIIIGVLLLLVGGGLFLGGAFAMDFDFTKWNTEETVTNTYDFSDEIRNITVDVDVAKVVFEPADDGKCTVICKELEKEKHTVEVRDGELRITSPERRSFHFSIGIHWNWDICITVKLPAGEYEKLQLETDTGTVEMPGDFSFSEAKCESDTGAIRWAADVKRELTLSTDTGAVKAENVTAGSLRAESDTGAVILSNVVSSGAVETECDTGSLKLTDVRGNIIAAKMDTGSVTMKNAVATSRIKVSSGTGSVRFDACDASEIKVKTGTGSVTGTFASPKIFYAESGTGKVSVPKSTEGGICDVETGTGKIDLDIVK